MWKRTTGAGAGVRSALSNPSVSFALAAVVLPNVPFVCAWIVGMPPRGPGILAYVLLAMVAHKLRRTNVYVAALATVVLLDVVLVLSGTFRLNPFELSLSLRHIVRVCAWRDTTYVLMLAAVVLFAAWTGYVTRASCGTWSTARRTPALLVACSLGVTDGLVNIDFSYLRNPISKGAPVRSAFETVDAWSAATARRDLLVVVVEGLGWPRSEAHRRLLTDRLQRDDLRAAYTVRIGASEYRGSTTNAEMRELCAGAPDYHAFIQEAPQPCVPEQLRAAGYSTTAFHSFFGAMFDRREWYPHVGFERSVFAEDMDSREIGVCGGVFRGGCDVDVSSLVLRQLRTAADRPQFVYWLTLNTHIPVDAGKARNSFRCRTASAEVPVEAVCDAFEVWADLFDAVATIASSVEHTDILIVGDHALPVWSRAGRRIFEPGKVMWAHLAAKAVLARSADGNAAPERGRRRGDTEGERTETGGSREIGGRRPGTAHPTPAPPATGTSST